MAPDGVDRAATHRKLAHVSLYDAGQAAGAKLAERQVDAENAEAFPTQERDVTSGPAADISHHAAGRKAGGQDVNMIHETGPGLRVLPGVLGCNQIVGFLGLANRVGCIDLHIRSA
jgi:hypothetical protein